jgi:hypothetical protein
MFLFILEDPMSPFFFQELKEKLFKIWGSGLWETARDVICKSKTKVCQIS